VQSFNISDAAVNYAVLRDSHALSYPIPNTDGSVEAGHRLINWLWYRNVSDLELDELLTGSERTRFKTSAPQDSCRRRLFGNYARKQRHCHPRFAK
jgi:hypothetical protein